MKTILIVDGDGLLTRSHFAVAHEIVTSNGIEIGGVDKFIHVLRRQIQNWNADAAYIAWDPSTPTTFRHTQYAQYKANREEKPEGLIYSKKVLENILPLLGATQEKNPLFEADDLVASMTHLASHQGWRAVVSTHDKDMMELLCVPNVIMAAPFDREPLTTEKVSEKFGIHPSQTIDYLSLLGDTSDNIPGVEGAGKKTASELLRKYQTLENIIDAAEQGKLTKKVGSYLILNKKKTLAFRDLMKLKIDAPVVSLESCIIRDPLYTELLPLLQSNNLHSLYTEAKQNSAEQGDFHP